MDRNWIAIVLGLAALITLVAVAVGVGGGLRPEVQPVVQNTTDTPRTPAGGAMTPKRSKSGHDITPLSPSAVAKLASTLDAEAFRVTQRAGTEPPFCGDLLDNKKDGVYTCVVCELPLFQSDHKFKSGTGWPSFYRPFDEEHVEEVRDESHGMVRSEIRCVRCTAHLGHVFDDGPRPTGLRYCLNSAALDFMETAVDPSVSSGATMPVTIGDAADAPAKTPEHKVAYFAGGCFWGLEHYFEKGPGVIDAVSGYMQGTTEKPTYKDVCYTDSGHAETVKVVYDPSKITYRRLLEAFFKMHDATQLNRQGPDVGSQYRSGIWYADEEQKKDAEAFMAELAAKRAFGGRPIVTQVEKARTFWPAEDYHQDYIVKTGRACHVTNPW